MQCLGYSKLAIRKKTLYYYVPSIMSCAVIFSLNHVGIGCIFFSHTSGHFVVYLVFYNVQSISSKQQQFHESFSLSATLFIIFFSHLYCCICVQRLYHSILKGLLNPQRKGKNTWFIWCCIYIWFMLTFSRLKFYFFEIEIKCACWTKYSEFIKITNVLESVN